MDKTETTTAESWAERIAEVKAQTAEAGEAAEAPPSPPASVGSEDNSVPSGDLTHIVLRPFTGMNLLRYRDELIPAEQWRTVKVLISNRYISPLHTPVPVSDAHQCECGRWSTTGECPSGGTCSAEPTT